MITLDLNREEQLDMLRVTECKRELAALTLAEKDAMFTAMREQPAQAWLDFYHLTVWSLQYTDLLSAGERFLLVQLRSELLEVFGISEPVSRLERW